MSLKETARKQMSGVFMITQEIKKIQAGLNKSKNWEKNLCSMNVQKQDCWKTHAQSHMFHDVAHY